jgi:hypothetical protein
VRATLVAGSLKGWGNLFAPLRVAHWGLVAVLFTCSLAACELYLRSGALWHLPLKYLLSFENDRHVLVSWEIHQPAPPNSVDVASFGSSIAAGVTELPGDQATSMLRAKTGIAGIRHLVLATPGGGFEEALTILENLADQHRPPVVAIFFTAPSSFQVRSEAMAAAHKTRMAELMPLHSSWVAAPDDENGVTRWMVQHFDVLLYRHFVNSWVRRRLDEGVTRGDWRLAVPYRSYRLAKPAKVPLEQLREIDQYSPSIVDLEQNTTLLEELLHRAISVGTIPLLVEDPMSYAVRERMAPVLPAYKKRVTEIAAATGVVYADLNQEVDLTGQFADVHHPTHEGGRRYFEKIVPLVAAALERRDAPSRTMVPATSVPQAVASN